MAPEDFDRIIDRRDTASEKWEKYPDSEILPMWVADTDFMSPPAIIEALQQRISHGVFGYTRTPAELTRLVIGRLQRLYDWHIEPDWLVWLPGLVCGLNISCRSVGMDGDTVLAPKPVYPPFMTAPRLSSRQLVTLPMQQQGSRWILDFAQLEAAITPDSRLLLFCNPHNPGGTCYRREELERLAAIARQYDLTICSDEVHCDLILQPGIQHLPLASLNTDIEARTITLMAPSKTYNIAGLGCSFAIIPDLERRNAFCRVRKGIVPDVNLLGYTAALAAYRDGDAWNQRQIDYLRGNRDYLVAQINSIPGLHMEPVEATYLAWIDISAARLENPARFFEHAGVGMSAGRDFGDDRFMRLNFGCPRGLLEEAVRRIRKAMVAHYG